MNAIAPNSTYSSKFQNAGHAFEIVPEYFWDKLSEDEKAKRLESYRTTFERAKTRVLARKNAKPEFWFDFGGGI